MTLMLLIVNVPYSFKINSSSFVFDSWSRIQENDYCTQSKFSKEHGQKMRQN
uniref:Uncharacterized protein n=1 Tax=Anguilla anguilla TaxID=7936 RepID=A0A0E9QDB7_ANGAN